MFDYNSLITMYRQEKAAVADGLGNSDFPAFRDWKAEYEAEYAPSHSGSSFIPMDLAVELTDAELDALPAG